MNYPAAPSQAVEFAAESRKISEQGEQALKAEELWRKNLLKEAEKKQAEERNQKQLEVAMQAAALERKASESREKLKRVELSRVDKKFAYLGEMMAVIERSKLRCQFESFLKKRICSRCTLPIYTSISHGTYLILSLFAFQLMLEILVCYSCKVAGKEGGHWIDVCHHCFKKGVRCYDDSHATMAKRKWSGPDCRRLRNVNSKHGLRCDRCSKNIESVYLRKSCYQSSREQEIANHTKRLLPVSQ